MPDQIKTISDKTNFEMIFNKFFQKNDVFLKTKNGDLKIKFFGYSNGIAAFKIPYIKTIHGNCLIFTRSGNNTIHALMKFSEKQEDNMFLFITEKFQIIFKAREEERRSLDGGGEKATSKSIIFATNLISYSIIQNSIAMETKKIERIKDYVGKELSEAFNYAKIFFCNEGKGDSRMQHFFKNKRPIFIPQINISASKDSEKEKYNFYINNIYSKDHFLQGKKEYISEISVPILYRLKMPYGYLQLNNKNIFSSSTLALAKKFAVYIDELLNKEKVFPKSEEKLIISNMSKNGLGIVFKERKYIRYFKENNLVHLDILLPQKKVASVLALVRNITISDNNIIMIGCSIEEIDALSEVNYDEFLESLPVEKQPEDQKDEQNPEQTPE
ncbi:MAG: hypothetical protein JXN64_03235 [Spirochaetes bacterium]|nr:hypothetical protein [Spirochaetota bacterium]